MTSKAEFSSTKNLVLFLYYTIQFAKVWTTKQMEMNNYLVWHLAKEKPHRNQAFCGLQAGHKINFVGSEIWIWHSGSLLFIVDLGIMPTTSVASMLGSFQGRSQGGSRHSGTSPLTPCQYSCWLIKLHNSKVGDSITCTF